MDKRAAYLAGTWYPKNKYQCEEQIIEFKKTSKIVKEKFLKYKIGIVPHAGWAYSGKLANNVIYNISLNVNPDLIILAGGHLGINDVAYVMNKCDVETPFGDLNCISEYNDALFNGVKHRVEEADNYEPDNTTELQLPFIKYYFQTNKIIICRIPPNETCFKFAQNVYEFIETKKINCAAIFSTDLTHYGFRFGFTAAGTGIKALNWVKNTNDREIIDFALELDSVNVLKSGNSKHNSCCSGAIAAGVELAKLIGCTSGKLVDYYTSADIGGEKSPSDFVGYSGIIF